MPQKRLHCTGDTRNRTSNNATPTPERHPHLPRCLPGCRHLAARIRPSRDQHTRPPLRISGAFFSTRNATRCNTRPAAATTQQQRRTDGTNWGVPRSSRTHSRGLPKHTGPSRSAQTPVEGGAISAARWLSLQQQRARSLERSTRPHKRRHRRICIGRMTRPHACSTA